MVRRKLNLILSFFFLNSSRPAKIASVPFCFGSVVCAWLCKVGRGHFVWPELSIWENGKVAVETDL